MGLRLAFLLALLLPEVPLDVLRAGAAPHLWHPLGFDDLGRDGLLRLGVAAARSLGLATATALVALALGALLALLGRRFESGRSVLRTLPPVLLLLPLADRVGALGWGPLVLVLGALLAFHAEPALAARFQPLLEGEALPAARVLGARPWHVARTWAPWVAGQCGALFPTAWLGAFWVEVAVRYLGLGPGPGSDSFGLLLSQELPRVVTEPSALGIASLATVLALALLAVPRPSKEMP